MHPQRVSSTLDDTLDLPRRPSAPRRPRCAPMRDRLSRDRARHYGNRTRHTAHHRDRTGAHAMTRSELTAWHHAQRRQQAANAALSRATPARALTQARMLATRSARSAARSSSPGQPGRRHSHSLNDLRNRRCERGNRATQRSAPLPQAARPRQRSGEGRSARRAIAFASTQAAHLDPHIVVSASSVLPKTVLKDHIGLLVTATVATRASMMGGAGRAGTRVCVGISETVEAVAAVAAESPRRASAAAASQQRDHGDVKVQAPSRRLRGVAKPPEGLRG